ncbi:hypothetical protein [Algibacter sp. L3A6]|uniref:hypothetical protein n=1 Tax=Algibacter sp. L3A6 TaxID=2686366 RepID=UPI00131CBCFD|nr:hypothetical protein [Algibacter sp. L3A6]
MNFKKVVVLILLLNVLNTYSQNWLYKSGQDAFDGDYRYCYVFGKGEFPYNKPRLNINVFNDNHMDFYISSSGYYPTENDIKVMLNFSNEPNVKYTSDFISLSKDNETIFLYSFKNELDSIFNRQKIIKKLKKGSSLNVRIITDFGDKNLTFSLANSSKAISFIYSDKYSNYIKDKEKKQKIMDREKKIVSDSIDNIFEQRKIESENKQKLLIEVLNKAGVVELEINKAIDILKYHLKNKSLNIYEIRAINLYINNFGILGFKMYNSKEELIDEISVQLPETYRNFREKK